MGVPIDDCVTGGQGSNAPSVPAGIVAPPPWSQAEIERLRGLLDRMEADKKDVALDLIERLQQRESYLEAAVAGAEREHDDERSWRRQTVKERDRARERVSELESTLAAQAQEIGGLRATDVGTEIAPGVRLVWQRGDVGVLTFEPGAIVGRRWAMVSEAAYVLAWLVASACIETARQALGDRR